MATASPPSGATAAGPAPSETPTARVGPSNPMDTPFNGLAKEFIDDLEVVSVDYSEKQKPPRRFLRAKEGKKPYLPGQPRIRLDKPVDDTDSNTKLLEYLQYSHNTDKLNELLPYMRYIFVQTPSHIHINPLHHQSSHERKIKVTESSGLHLVWYYDLIFIKPVPAYFYSQAFWDYIENANREIYRACLGFMRSYERLIQYEIDFHQACENRLIPRKSNGELPTYEEWCEFIVPFAQVGDNHVNRRYHYGELRLTRINRAAFFFRGSLAYFHIYPQWGSWIHHTLAPIVTLFAVCSVVLNSMQVSLAAMDLGRAPQEGAWTRLIDASLWFPIAVMLTIAVVLAVALIGVGYMGMKDLSRGNEVRQQKKRGDAFAGSRSHGMVW
ncbi:hypothetical protein C8A03DRAFT_16949 [Achaetomium macrosporum]|uniref:Uncharacterized protein n=1 Tax=Achaetomium macrosporum TaxID=79813 RepID=A0AAN7C8M9_9PEZI|nr:hypothetical protein C8A03DRAFT_16949 [Achaetomium macrosporum]